MNTIITAREAFDISNYSFTSEDEWTLLNIQGIIISAANRREYSVKYIANETVIDVLRMIGYIVSERDSVGVVTISWDITG